MDKIRAYNLILQSTIRCISEYYVFANLTSYLRLMKIIF